jgi:hypothetical protein
MNPMQPDEPILPRLVTLRHGNPPGDPNSSPRCGAKNRKGTPCRAPAMWSKRAGKYTRCRMHGGASTGPRTREGLARSRRANWKGGFYSRAKIEERQFWKWCIRWLRARIRRLQGKKAPTLQDLTRTPAGQRAFLEWALRRYGPGGFQDRQRSVTPPTRKVAS